MNRIRGSRKGKTRAAWEPWWKKLLTRFLQGKSGFGHPGWWLGGVLVLLAGWYLLAGLPSGLSRIAPGDQGLELAGESTGLLPATPTPALSSNPAAQTQELNPDFSIEPNEVTLLEIVKFYRQMSGHRIITQGMVHRGKRTPAGHFVLYQYILVDKQDDLQTVAVLVNDSQAAKLPLERWVRVEGVLSVRHETGFDRLVVNASQVSRIPKPPAKDQYLLTY